MRLFGYLALCSLSLASATTLAAPGDVLFTDRLNGNMNQWTVVSGGGDASIGNETRVQGRSMRLRWGAVTATSDVIPAAVPGAQLEAWIRRGSDSFSENPDANEDLVVEYFTSTGSWSTLELFQGSGTPGQIYLSSYTLPADALHANLQIRLGMTAGSGSDWDYWHVDDVIVTETALTSGVSVSYSFEEDVWTGAPGEVLDSGAAALHGTAVGGAVNQSTTPAIPTNPGSCRYAELDGVDDYIEIADDPALDLPNTLTVAAWINMRTLPSGLHTIVSKDWNYEVHIDSSGRVFWWWNDSGGTVRSLTSAAPISLNQWHHIAVTYESGAQTIYVDGAPAASSTYTGTLRLNDLPLYIGTDWNFISRAFDGYIDEVNVLSRALSQAEVQAAMNQVHPCPITGAVFVLNHDTFGINCVAETIAVDVVDAMAGTPLLNYNATVQLDTQSGNGTWSLLVGGGLFIDAAADDGLATYDWPLGESQTVFQLDYPQGTPSIDVDVYQVSNPGIRDNDGEGNLVFSPNGFTLTAVPLTNPPPPFIAPFATPQVAGTDFGLYIAAYGQTPTDPACGIIESYTGPRTLKFWSAYVDPGVGTIPVTVDGGAIATAEGAAADQPVVFTNGQAAVTGKYKDAGQMQILVKDDTVADPDLPTGIRGATADFVVKPDHFELTNIIDGGGSPNPGAVDSAGPVFIAAGAPFSATVTAFDAEGDVTPNYGRESTPETVRLTGALVDPAVGNNPPVSAPIGFGPFAGGQATGADFAWSEVGIIALVPSVGDGSYFTAGDVTGLASSNVGRFIPDRFAVSLNGPEFTTACALGGYTYMGDTFVYAPALAPVISVIAQAVGGGTTQNYTGGFFKIDNTSLANRLYSAAMGTLDTSGLPPVAADPVIVDLGGGAGTLTFSAGTGLSFTRSVPEAPFDADIQMSIDVIDADGVLAAGNPITFGGAGGIVFDAGDRMRFGRVRLFNALGSEQVDLSLPMRAEYFLDAVTGFVPHTDDACTTGVSLSLGAFTLNLTPGDTCVLDSGMPGDSGEGCAAPAPPGQRFREPPLGGDFNLFLAAPGAGADGSTTVTADVPDWLKFDWDPATPGLENPSGTARFGIFSGEARRIYTRELY